MQKSNSNDLNKNFIEEITDIKRCYLFLDKLILCKFLLVFLITSTMMAFYTNILIEVVQQSPTSIHLLLSFIFTTAVFVFALIGILIKIKINKLNCLAEEKSFGLSSVIRNYIETNAKETQFESEKDFDSVKKFFWIDKPIFYKERIKKIDSLLSGVDLNLFDVQQKLISQNILVIQEAPDIDIKTIPKLQMIRRQCKIFHFWFLFFSFTTSILFFVFALIAIIALAIKGDSDFAAAQISVNMLFGGLSLLYFLSLIVGFFAKRKSKQILFNSLTSLPWEIRSLIFPWNQSIFLMSDWLKSFQIVQISKNIDMLYKNESHIGDESIMEKKVFEEKMSKDKKAISLEEELEILWLENGKNFDHKDPKIIESFKELKETRMDLEKFTTLKLKWYWLLPIFGVFAFYRETKKEELELEAKDSLILKTHIKTNLEVSGAAYDSLQGIVFLLSFLLINLIPFFEYKILRARMRERTERILLLWPHFDFRNCYHLDELRIPGFKHPNEA